MTTELALVPPSVPTITSDQRALIKKTIAKDATDAELELFFFDCTRRGVHPLDRLIHFTKRAGKYTPVTSIDFMRSRAAATGDYAGQDDTVFTGSPKTPTFLATVTVWKFVHGEKCKFVATARWSEYKPDQDFMWQKMPHTLLAKCAEALALRKGFPQELSGLYEAAELQQSEHVDTETGEVVDDPLPLRISPAQIKRLHTIATNAGWKRDEFAAFRLKTLGVESSKDIPVSRYDEFCQLLEMGTEARASEEPEAE